MRADLIQSSLRISAGLTVLGSVLIATAAALGPWVALGFLVGGIWSTLNIWGMSQLVQNAFPVPNKKKLILIFLLKFPVLYGAGFLLLLYARIHPIGALAGFSLPLVVTVLKSGGRALSVSGMLKEEVEKSERDRNKGQGSASDSCPATH